MAGWRNSIFKMPNYPPAIKRQKSYPCVQVLCVILPEMGDPKAGFWVTSFFSELGVHCNRGKIFIINLFSSSFLMVLAGH